MYAGHMKLDNLIVFTDFNKLQLDGEVGKLMISSHLQINGDLSIGK